MQNMSISARLIVAFLICATLILAIAGVSAMAIERVASATEWGRAEMEEHPEKAESVKGEIARAVQSSRVLVLTAAMLGCMICTTMGVLMTRVIGQPLRIIRARLEELAEGKAPECLPFPEENLRQDDMGRIIRALNALIDARKGLDS